MTSSASVIVVNWNGGAFLSACVEGLQKQTYGPLEIIIVDNASGDGSLEWLRRQGGIRLIESSTNLGYCGGANRGFRDAQGEWILVLNQDVVLAPDYFSILMRYAAVMPQAGFFSGLLLNENGEVDSAGQVLSRTLRPRERGYQISLEKYSPAQEESYIFSVCGAAAFYRAEMLNQLKEEGEGEVFDESFFSYSEDLDLGWRAQRLGWKGYYVPSACAIHQRGAVFQNPPPYPPPLRGRERVGGASFLIRHWKIFDKPDWLQAHILMNRYAVLIKHAGQWLIFRQLSWILMADVPLWLVLFLTRPQVISRWWSLRHVWVRAWRYRRRVPPLSSDRVIPWIE